MFPVLCLEYHLVILPKEDDPSKAILAACTESQLIKLAAKQFGSKTGESTGQLTWIGLPYKVWCVR